ncbi:SDR family oxidoreductase [Paenibacillus thiaminolyticus]|uniref:SDR family oxidoreductase n=1 Tax=Paenibacillus thiaminolyticus TaxID=49283 RepID=UPI0035A5C3A4
MLLDYSATQGAIVAFTRSLSTNLAPYGIRVNGVAPVRSGPGSFRPRSMQVSQFGRDTPMQRPGQPEVLTPSYVYLAGADSSYVTGQILHVNGDENLNR